MADFDAVIRKVKTWDGADVWDLIPTLWEFDRLPVDDRYERHFEDLKAAIDAASIERSWPEGLAEHIDWIALDPDGKYIWREMRGGQYTPFSVYAFPDFDAMKLGDEVTEFCSWVKPLAQAAKCFGMSRRTLEGVRQGRGFRYPEMLRLAMKALAADGR